MLRNSGQFCSTYYDSCFTCLAEFQVCGPDDVCCYPLVCSLPLPAADGGPTTACGCLTDFNCPNGFYCSAWSCVPYSIIGASCQINSNRCSPGLECINNVCSKTSIPITLPSCSTIVIPGDISYDYQCTCPCCDYTPGACNPEGCEEGYWYCYQIEICGSDVDPTPPGMVC